MQHKMFIFETREKRVFCKNNLTMVRKVGSYDGVSKMKMVLLILSLLFIDAYNNDSLWIKVHCNGYIDITSKKYKIYLYRISTFQITQRKKMIVQLFSNGQKSIQLFFALTTTYHIFIWLLHWAPIKSKVFLNQSFKGP